MVHGQSGRPHGFRVTVTDREGRPARAPGLARWLETVAPSRARGEVVIALVPDAAMRRLNRRYAGVDRVTDVLSFAAAPRGRGPGQQIAAGARATSDKSLGHLGDIVIASGRADSQARAAGHPLRTELRVLALHGLLHLLGYDHHGDAGTMARLERRLRRRGGLREGLIERATP